MKFNKVIGKVDSIDLDYNKSMLYISSPLECYSIVNEYISDTDDASGNKVKYVGSYIGKFYIVIKREQKHDAFGDPYDAYHYVYEIRCTNTTTGDDVVIKSSSSSWDTPLNITKFMFVCKYKLDSNFLYQAYYIKDNNIYEVTPYSYNDDWTYRGEYDNDLQKYVSIYRDVKVFNTDIGQIAKTIRELKNTNILEISITKTNKLQVKASQDYKNTYIDIADVSSNAYIYHGGITTDGKFGIEVRE